MRYDRSEDLKWLIERSHEAYLTWIAVWLASMIGIVTILVSLKVNPGEPLSDHDFVSIVMFWGLILGMIFSVFRLVNCAKETVNWALDLKKIGKRKEIIQASVNERGPISLFFVDRNGVVCRTNRVYAYSIHVLVSYIFLGLTIGDFSHCAAIAPAIAIFLISISMELYTWHSDRERKAKNQKTWITENKLKEG